MTDNVSLKEKVELELSDVRFQGWISFRYFFNSGIKLSSNASLTHIFNILNLLQTHLYN